ncbi:MAG: hypothetical protein R2847_03485 [Bacteroidia bacterium]
MFHTLAEAMVPFIYLLQGNNGPVTYLWSTGAVSNNLLNVVTGNYTVTVTDSSGCVATKSQVITQPASALSITVSSLPASCGSANGSASASVTGGTCIYLSVEHRTNIFFYYKCCRRKLHSDSNRQ